MVSESQKKAIKKWQKENMTTLGCRVRKEKAEEFKQACKKMNTVPNQILLKKVDEIIEKAKDLP